MPPQSVSFSSLRAIPLIACAIVCRCSLAEAQAARAAPEPAGVSSAPAAKRLPKHKEYHDILEESDLVILGEIVDGQVLQLKNEVSV